MGKERYFTNLQEYQEKHYGRVISMQDIEEDREAYAEMFSEGSKPLKTILLGLWARGYQTSGCCKGHKLKPFYVRTGRHRGRISEEEYQKKRKSPLFFTTIGYQKGPEYAGPYIAITNMTEKQAKELGKFLMDHLQANQIIEIVIQEGGVFVSFENQKDENGQTQNEVEWEKIGEAFADFFQYLDTKKNWREKLRIEYMSQNEDNHRDAKSIGNENTRTETDPILVKN